MATTYAAIAACTHVQKDGKTYSGIPKSVFNEIAEVEHDGIVWE